MTITPARLREIEEGCASDGRRGDPLRSPTGRSIRRDLLTLIRELLEPEPGCGSPNTPCRKAMGFPTVRHTPDCPVAAHRTRREALRQAMED